MDKMVSFAVRILIKLTYAIFILFFLNVILSVLNLESGRFFVWGHNQYGQLGAGTQREVITKPTVIRQFSDHGIIVKDVAFGFQFTVVLSDDNKVYYVGRIVFPPGSRIYSLKGHSQMLDDDVTEFADTFCELGEFDFFTELETLDFDRVYAGGNHFIVQTKCGRLIGWGQNGANQLGQVEEYKLSKEPVQLPIKDVKDVICGNEYTLIVTSKGNTDNLIYKKKTSFNFCLIKKISLQRSLRNWKIQLYEFT